MFAASFVAVEPSRSYSMGIRLVPLDAARHLRSMFAASFVAVEPSRSYSMLSRLVHLDLARHLRSMFAASFVAVEPTNVNVGKGGWAAEVKVAGPLRSRWLGR
jgi:hypothetical protein